MISGVTSERMRPIDLVTLTRTIATRHGLDPVLVCALVEQESSWDAHAIRYEPAFRERYVSPLSLPPTEEIARSISWGLMQVMGQVAREHGFAAKFLSALCNSEIGLEIGCIVLTAILSKAAGDVPRALTLWNGGKNADYSNEVLARVNKYR